MNESYIPLQVFSAFSLQDSVINISDLIQLATVKKIPALGLVDRSNFFAMVSFYQKALKAGIKPLLGSTLVITYADKKINCSVYCKNIEGFRLLSAAISSLFQKTPFDNCLQINSLKNTGQLLIIVHQDIASLDSYDFDRCHDELLKNFDKNDIFFGVERYKDDNHSFQESKIILHEASKRNIATVCANKVFFLKEEDYQCQQIKYCIQKGLYLSDNTRTVKHFPGQYLYDIEQLQQLFSDCPTVLSNTLSIAKKCTLEIDFSSVFLPQFSDDENLTLRQMALIGLQEREESSQLYCDDSNKYQERLLSELDVIKTMGFAGYFLIVADFIQWAKRQNIAVGPGRGSGAGSLVAYALKITDLDPLRYNLLFERFLNPERVSMPDFDIDFCMDKRDLVIQYVQDRYGHQNVSQIATFGTMAAKAVIRDVGRVLSHPYGFVDKIAKLIPMDIGITLNEALEQSDALKSLYDEDEVVKDLIEYALKLEGLPRNVGKHAGGVIIAPKNLDYFCPLYNEPNSPWQPISQLDKDDIEKIGLVKFDFLGLKTLTVLDWTYQNLNPNQRSSIPNLDKIPLDCQECYEQLKQANTTAVFQLESRGMKQLIIKLQPDCFEDMIALVALFRPGPLQSGMVDDFIDRKHGRSPIVYQHSSLESILQPTYGVILYQEQVMQIAQVLAGYSLGQADLLRRAMGKKKVEEMAQQRTIFIEGCLQNQIERECAQEIFDLMEKFAGYGFNKSHSAAYALIAYQTLYLKTHASAAFFAANLSADDGNLEKIHTLVLDAQRSQIKVLSPDINQSTLLFTTKSEKEILYGLRAVKGLGEQLIEQILQIRQEQGLFKDFDDFMQKTSSLKIQKRQLEIMAQAGIFDCFQLNRRHMCEQLIEKKVYQYYQSCQQQGLLFDFDACEQQQDLSSFEDFLWSEKLDHEIRLLGLSFSGQLLDPYKALKQDLFFQLESFENGQKQQGCFIAFAESMRDLTSSAGVPFSVLTLQDGSCQIDLLLNRQRHSSLVEQCTNLLQIRQPLIVSLEKTLGRQKKEFISLKHIWSLGDYLLQYVKTLHFSLDESKQHCDRIQNFFNDILLTQLPLSLSVKLVDQKQHSRTYLGPRPSSHSLNTLDLNSNRQDIEKTFLILIEKSFSLGMSVELISA